MPVKSGARPRAGRFVLLAMNTLCVAVAGVPGAVVVVVLLVVPPAR